MLVTTCSGAFRMNSSFGAAVLSSASGFRELLDLLLERVRRARHVRCRKLQQQIELGRGAHRAVQLGRAFAAVSSFTFARLLDHRFALASATA